MSKITLNSSPRKSDFQGIDIDLNADELARPFDPVHGISMKDAQTDTFFKDLWQQIDNEERMGYLGKLALKLDSYTNYTSLVLAIELEEMGKVLLFPGDAQVGNGQS